MWGGCCVWFEGEVGDSILLRDSRSLNLELTKLGYNVSGTGSE